MRDVLDNINATFGGLINESDYGEYYSMADIAKRIKEDERFDKKCRENELKRENNSRK